MKESPAREMKFTSQDSDFAEAHNLSLNKSKAPRSTDFVLAPLGAVFYTTLSAAFRSQRMKSNELSSAEALHD